MLVFFLIALCCYFWWRRRYFLLLDKIPTYPNVFPLIGQFLFSFNIKGLFNYLKSLSAFANRQNGVAKFWLGPFSVVVISNPEDAETVLNSCLNKGSVYKFSKPWVGDGLITSKASIWKRDIKKLAPAFNQRVIDGFLDTFNLQSEILVKILKKKIGHDPFDIYPYIGAANLDIICQTAMGTKMDIQSTLNHSYLKAIKTILKIITTRSSSIWLHIGWFFNLTKLKTKQDKAIMVLHKVSNDIIKQKELKFADNKQDPRPSTYMSARIARIKLTVFYGDLSLFIRIFRTDTQVESVRIRPQALNFADKFQAFLDLMLEINSRENSFTAREMREQVDTMIAAGHETSAHAILFTLLSLATHTQIQDKVYQELKEVFNDEEVQVTKSDLSKLVYLEAVIKESLRLFPVVPMVFRYIDKDVQLKNYTIPRGCNCAISIWGLNRNDRWGEDFNTFRPERWLNPEETPQHPASFASFSYGRRVCIGRKYAMMSMKIMLSHLLRRLRFKADITRVDLNVHFVLKPVANHMMTIEER